MYVLISLTRCIRFSCQGFFEHSVLYCLFMAIVLYWFTVLSYMGQKLTKIHTFAKQMGL